MNVDPLALVTQRALALVMALTPLPAWSDEPAGLRPALFLLDHSPGRDAEAFLIFTLPRLMRQLRHRTEVRTVHTRGAIRGRVHWPTTTRIQFEQRDPGRLVCRRTVHEFDTPENRLLLLMVLRCAEALDHLPPLICDGSSLLPDGRLLSAEVRVARMRASVNHFFGNSLIQHVTRIQRVDDSHIRHAESSRMREYVAARHLFAQHQRLFHTDRPEAVLAEVARRSLPLPADSESVAGEQWLRWAAGLLVLSRGPALTEAPDRPTGRHPPTPKRQ